MSDENGSNKSKYKQRKLMRLAGHAPKPRDPPKYYAEFMADFLLREKEQVEAARQGPLSSDPQRPWGSRRVVVFRNPTAQEEQEMDETEVKLVA